MSTHKPEGSVGGAHTFIDRDELLKPIAKKYGRDHNQTCLKIGYKFFLYSDQTLATFNWGGINLPILDCAKLQNICYWHGLAPRVYAVEIIKWKGLRAVAQLQDYAGKGEGSNKLLFKKVVEVIEEYGGFHRFSDTDGGTWNSAGNKWLAFKAAGFVYGPAVYSQKINKMSGIEKQRHLANYKGEFNEDFITIA